MGKSEHHLSATSANLRGGDVDGLGDDDGGHGGRQREEQPGERRAVAHRGPAVQERPVDGQAAERRHGRPGVRRLSAPVASRPPPSVAARVQGVVVGRLERQHFEGDIETVAAQPLPAGPQQDVQRAEQHGQRGVRGRFAPTAAEHGQVTVGQRDSQVRTDADCYLHVHSYITFTTVFYRSPLFILE